MAGQYVKKALLQGGINLEALNASDAHQNLGEAQDTPEDCSQNLAP